MDKHTVYRSIRIAKQKKLINNQQKKTLVGQVKSGDFESANKGLKKIVKRKLGLGVG